MKISNLSAHHDNLSFKAAQINIIATSDNHGQLTSLPQFYNAIEDNKQDIFQKADKSSTLNLFVNAGDFYINPSKYGFLTYPNATNGNIQKAFLAKLIHLIKSLTPENSNFAALYTPGNHCFDGGDETFFELIDIPDMTTVVTNINRDESSKDCNKIESILKSKNFVIPDSDDPEYKHHILYIGATIPTMQFYNPGLLNKLKFYDDSNKKDANIQETDLIKTFSVLNEQVSEFRKDYPEGIVLLGSHMGTRISKMIRDNVPGINEIFDAHKHDCVTISKGMTTISSLGENNEVLKYINLNIEKNGDIERNANTISTENYKLRSLDSNPLNKLLNDTFANDIESLIKIIDRKKELDKLSYNSEIRYSNSPLANFLTRGVKKALLKTGNSIDLVGLQSSIIRGGLENDSSNLDIMKVFDGVSENLSGIQVGEVSGEDLVGLVIENIADNLKDKTRNTIIHWSDLQVNRSMIADILKEGHQNISMFQDAVKIRDIDDGSNFVKLNPYKNYKIAIAEKYLVKDDIKYPKKIRDNFKPIGKTYNGLFREHLEDKDYILAMTDKVKEKRIL